ncbi:aldo/keto reductase [Streptomyces sp. NPDC079020]|uniref:aldo/keto reductase n=1 Tax=unclassified Streptomyces TaxID=2593676 RepID=UPI002E7A4726|nr:aldo/keto reductase [Streptomyces sp. BE147]MEE1742162.1 aldo/keto reductase [Streptomyces sp. BE147]
MYQPVPADRTNDHVESDVMDLAAVSIADLRRLPAPDPGPRLLAEIRRARGNAMVGGSEPGRAE